MKVLRCRVRWVAVVALLMSITFLFVKIPLIPAPKVFLLSSSPVTNPSPRRQVIPARITASVKQTTKLTSLSTIPVVTATIANKADQIHSQKMQEERKKEEKEEEDVGELEMNSEDEQDSYVQDYPDYTPPDFVEVKKSKPKVTHHSTSMPLGKQGSHLPSVHHRHTNISRDSFTPEALRKRALAFPPSSKLRKFLDEQERRTKRVTDMCHSFGASQNDILGGGRGPPMELSGMWTLLVDRQNHLAFCPVFKAASTSWTITLLEIAGYWTKKIKEQKLQAVVKEVFPKISNLAIPSVTQKTTRFFVVRHPFERLLSCYRDKFEHARKYYYYARYGEKMIRRFRQFPGMYDVAQKALLQDEVNTNLKLGLPAVFPGNPYTKPLGPTFLEFVKYITSSTHDDEHWRPYYRHCSVCYVEYDFILKFESLYKEGKQFLEYLNRSSEVNVRWDNPTGGGTTTSDIACSYYKQLPLEYANKLVKKYEIDLKVFEYKPDEYINCAKGITPGKS